MLGVHTEEEENIKGVLMKVLYEREKGKEKEKKKAHVWIHKIQNT